MKQNPYDAFPKRAETVRFYDAEIPSRGHSLREWRELTQRLTPDELERFKEIIEEALLKEKSICGNTSKNITDY